MLDVVCPNDSLTSTVVHHLMCYAPRLAETGIHPCTITAEHCIGRDEWLQHRFHRLRIQPFQLKVGLMARPVLHHHHRDVIPPGPPGTPFPATMSCRTRQPSLPLERFEEEGFIHFNNAFFPCCLVVCHRLQEAVTPQEGGVLANTAADGGLADSEPVDESLGVVLPMLSLT